MKNRFILFFKKYPLFLYLLPVFFVLHGFRENYDYVTIPDALWLTATYIAVSVMLMLVFYLLYKTWQKAALLTLLLVSFHFFFGVTHDTLRKITHNSSFSGYIFLLPFALGLFILVIIYLKKTKRTFKRTGLYLNALFILLIFLEAIMLTGKIVSVDGSTKSPEFSTVSISAKPDLYLIVLDEYSGLEQLKKQLNFDNSPFENELRKEKFHVVTGSRSNYLGTPLSIASLFKMDYLDLKGVSHGQDEVLASYNEIRRNKLLRYFGSLGYEFYNFSIFDFPGQQAKAQATFLPEGKTLITSQTFLSRIERDLGYHLYSTFGFKQNLLKYIYIDLRNNTLLYDQTIKTTSLRTGKPKFVYTHLMMPHYPYYFTKEGKQRSPEELLVKNKVNKQFYTEYLIYCNSKIRELITAIKQNSPGSIIVLTGDHGFRALDEVSDKSYLFKNLCSVFLPSQDYSQFYDGVSIVNLFRVIVNTEFRQRLPLLKDSCVME